MKRITATALALLMLLSLVSCSPSEAEQTTEPLPSTTVISMKPFPWSVSNEPLVVSDLGAYSGNYMEDGSDALISNVLMLVVKNTSDKAVEYAEISVDADFAYAKFTVSALPAGESAVVLESAQMVYDPNTEYSLDGIVASYYEDNSFTLHPELFDITGAEGEISVKNISDKSISGPVYVYYKLVKDGFFLGGITYRAVIEDGISAGETAAAQANHYSDEHARLLFVSYNGEKND